jgi:hypothetical protein
MTTISALTNLVTRKPSYAPATLGGFQFYLNPESAQWTYRTKANVEDTVTGRVIQVYGDAISNIVITGSFGSGAYAEQTRFFNQVHAWAEQNLGGPAPTLTGGEVIYNGPPIKFIFPVHGWDMTVWVIKFMEPPTTHSVNLTYQVINHRFLLELCVAQTNSSTVMQASTANMIDALQRVAAQFGYYPDEKNFSGPLGTLKFPPNPPGGS